MSQYDLKINIGHCDLYFIGPVILSYILKTIYVWTSLFGILSQYDPKFNLKINKVTVTYISWFSDFALHLEDYLMYEHHTLGLWVSITRRLASK